MYSVCDLLASETESVEIGINIEQVSRRIRYKSYFGVLYCKLLHFIIFMQVLRHEGISGLG